MQQRFFKRIRRDGRERLRGADLSVHVPKLAVFEPHTAGQDRLDGVVIGAEITRLHPPHEANVPAVQQRRVIEHRVNGLERRRGGLPTDFEQKALYALVSAPEGDHHAAAGLSAADQLLRHKIDVEPVSGIRNGRDCDASKHFLCHTVSPFALFKTYFAMCVSIFSAVSLPAATSLMAVVTGFSQRG